MELWTRATQRNQTKPKLVHGSQMIGFVDENDGETQTN